jgi:hypothetical protein
MSEPAFTQADLDALPETGGDFGQKEIVLDGHRVVVPIPNEGYLLYTRPDEVNSVIDSEGRRWMIGWWDGVRYKRKAR